SSPRAAPSHQAHPHRVSRVSRAAMRRPNQLRKVASTAAARPPEPCQQRRSLRLTFTLSNTDFDESLAPSRDGYSGRRPHIRPEHASLAQLAEHLSLNQGGGGWGPSPRT